jgi:hypothetical protein
MYEPLPTEEEAAEAGFVPEDYAGESVEVWPENWPAYLLFFNLRRQWRVGMGGATGLDHNVMFHRMDRMNLTPEEYGALEADIMAMEDEALRAMAGGSRLQSETDVSQ